MLITKTFTLNTSYSGTLLEAREINLLFEAFNYFPVYPNFALRSGLIGLGKSRILIANQDQLRNILFEYIQELSREQQERVKELICEWEKLSTKIVKYEKAERVDFRITAPEEQRKLILKRIQTYIPIFRQTEIPPDLGGTGLQSYGNDNYINRG